MVILCIDPECDGCRHLAELLSKRHVAHQLRRIHGGFEHHRPHCLIRGGERIIGHDAIRRTIEELSADLDLSYVRATSA